MFGRPGPCIGASRQRYLIVTFDRKNVTKAEQLLMIRPIWPRFVDSACSCCLRPAMYCHYLETQPTRRNLGGFGPGQRRRLDGHTLHPALVRKRSLALCL